MRMRAVVVGVCSVALVAGCSSSTEMSPQERDQSLRKSAIKVCEGAVKNGLKDPSSAEFRNEEITESTAEVSYTVMGEVNANNSFGGKVGFQAYRCTATYDKDKDELNARSNLLGAG